MSHGLKKQICTALALLLIIAGMLIPSSSLLVHAASYPEVFFFSDPGLELDDLVVSYDMNGDNPNNAIYMQWWPKYNNEGYILSIYNSEGVKVAEASQRFTNASTQPRAITVRWNTTEYSYGEYEIEVKKEFYSFYKWNEAPSASYCWVTLLDSATYDSKHPVPRPVINFDEFVAPEGCAYQFRLYNPNTGEHFYTGSQEETQNLVNAGWNFEGSGFITPTTGDPIYRLYSAEHSDHFYTTSESERDALLADNWTLDGDTGIAFPSAPAETGRPMYRLYNPNAYPNGEAGAHHFTMSWEEVENLQAEGWQYEFIAWYSV